MNKEMAAEVSLILSDYDPKAPVACAAELKAYWLTFDANRGLGLIKAEQLAQYEASGTPVPVLKEIGAEIAKLARKDVDRFLPLAQLLWDEYGREGRIVGSIIFGALELAAPARIVSLLRTICPQCVSWEDADRLSMDALEPILRKEPEKWFGQIESWLTDASKWNRRAAITAIGRLPMKVPAFVERCIAACPAILGDDDLDVKRAVSFALRICAKTAPDLVIAFLREHLPASKPASAWVLCDVVRSLDKKLLPRFAVLRPVYQQRLAQSNLPVKDLRAIESALKLLADVK